MIERKKLYIFFSISFILLGLLCLYIFHSLINTILLGAVLGYVMYPLYNWMASKTKKPRISSFLVCLLFILIISLPMLTAINLFAVEIFGISKSLSEKNILKNVGDCDSNSTLCNAMKSIAGSSMMETTLNDVLSEITDFMRKYIGEMLLKLPYFILHTFIIIFMMYFILLDGKTALRRMYSIIPISECHKKIIATKIRTTLAGVVFGNIIVGLIQGLLGGIGFWIFGLKAPILWGIIMFLFSFVPVVGTGIVWGPATIYMIINGLVSNNNVTLWLGIGLLAYSSIFVALCDNFLRPKIVAEKAKIHPLLVLFAVIGGITAFNIAGIIIGPLIVGIFIAVFELFEEEKNFLFNNSNKSNICPAEKSSGRSGKIRK